MKKFLSLVLALVMTMSLVTVSAGAKDFTDNDELNYEEAVAVMSELKVVGGYADGSFNPQGNLTRQAAAKIICNLILGPTTASALRADTAPFKDVAVDNQFAGYITYCAQQGIINGYADGTFRPGAPLTGYAFMKMLLGALGYDGSIEGYVGPNWSVQVAKRAIGIGLNAGLVDAFNGVKTVNREEAALYAFNTLKSTMVEYDSRTTVSVGGAEVVIAGSAAQDVANSGKETIKDDNKLQFAEKYFSKLVLNDDTTDVFGRPANTWTYNKKEIGTYADYTLLVESYTEGVKGNEIYDLLGAAAVAENSLAVYVDGVDMTDSYAKQVARNYKKTFATTGNGVLTEVYMDVDEEEITVVEINTYLAVATDDYNEKKDTVALEIQGAKKDAKDEYVKSATDVANAVIEGENFAIAEDLKADDVVLVTVAQGGVQSVSEPEVMDDVTISSFKKNDNYTIEGDNYVRADAGVWENLLDMWTQGSNVNLKDRTYNVYLDAYGYVIGIVVNKAEDNYVFITGYDTFTSGLATRNAEAFAIFVDGTTENIKVKKPADLGWKNSESTLNSWFTYTVDKNGVYTLGEISRAHNTNDSVAQFWTYATTAINDVDISMVVEGTGSKYAYGNSKTNYLVAELGELDKFAVITGVESVITGVKNADLLVKDHAWANTQTGATATSDTDNILTGGAYPLYNTTTGSIIACVVVGEDNNTTDNLVYVTGDVSRESYDPTEDEFTWTQDGLLNGKEVTLTYKGDVLAQLDDSLKNNWVEVIYKADGTVKGVDVVVENDWGATGDYITNFDTFNKMQSGKKDVALIRNGLKDDVTKITIDGYTLVITNVAYGSNIGVDLAEDCNAVVIENWNNSELRVDTYSTVKSAVSALGTKTPNGMVYTVMTKGLATTVVFVNTDAQFDNETDSEVGAKFNIDSAVLTKNANNNLTATWSSESAMNNVNATVKFYLKDGTKSYLVDTVLWSGSIAANANGVLSSTKTIVENGDYYATIVLTDAQNKVVASATTDTESFAH